MPRDDLFIAAFDKDTGQVLTGVGPDYERLRLPACGSPCGFDWHSGGLVAISVSRWVPTVSSRPLAFASKCTAMWRLRLPPERSEGHEERFEGSADLVGYFRTYVAIGSAR